jgi:Gluconate 2-dehydrogenase subunit 3
VKRAEEEQAIDHRPTDPRTGRSIGPLAQPGYYPGYSTLKQRKFWDAKTREVVLDRVENVPPVRFFTPQQASLMEAIAARIIPQDDRDEAHRIPIVPYIDKRLHEDRHDGYRHEDMPPDREAFPLGLQGIEEIARKLHGRSFTALGPREQDEVLQTVHHGKPPAGQEIWKRLPVHRFWMLLVKDCAEVYYAHPWAWDEIGYGGPAYPRGYMRLEHGEPEPWEVEERRYEWKAPESSLSDEYEPISGTTEHYATPGQQGTH